MKFYTVGCGKCEITIANIPSSHLMDMTPICGVCHKDMNVLSSEEREETGSEPSKSTKCPCGWWKQDRLCPNPRCIL